MSLAAVKQFVDRIRTDEALRQEMDSLKDRPYEEKLKLGVARGAALGFQFTADELSQTYQVKNFCVSVAKDGAVKGQLQGLDSLPPDKVVAKMVKVASENGHQFSADNMVQVMGLLEDDHQEGELNEEDLEKATGGSLLGSINIAADMGKKMAQAYPPPTYPPRTSTCW